MFDFTKRVYSVLLVSAALFTCMDSVQAKLDPYFLNQLWSQSSPGIEGTPEQTEIFGSSVAAGDFNGDGFEDLAIGTTRDTISGLERAGSVSVIYGGSTGLNATSSQLWYQGVPLGIAGTPESDDDFGWAVSSGDFDDDGFDDLAIGIPGDFSNRAGSVLVLHGSSLGLTSFLHQSWTQGVGPVGEIGGTPEEDDRFGAALTTGHFNGDAYADLAIGVPAENDNTGALHVLYGSSSGLSDDSDVYFARLALPFNLGDRFATELAAADFNGDGLDDLAVGIPGANLEVITDAGQVQIIYGDAKLGIVPPSIGTAAEYWTQNSSGIDDEAEANDEFGHDLTTGDFNGDDYQDLAIGVYAEDIDTVTNAGGVNVIYGSKIGLRPQLSQFYQQNFLTSAAEEGDIFGWSLAAGDFNNDGRDDLAVGARSEDFGPALPGAGLVDIIYGAPFQLSFINNRVLSQGEPGMIDKLEPIDLFGHALASGDFDGNGFDDLAVGVLFETIDVGSQGAVHVIYSASADDDAVFADRFD